MRKKNTHKKKRQVCVILTDRANYGRLWPVMRAIQQSPDLELKVICSGTMVLERFGHVEKNVEKDGFQIDGRVYMELEGSTPSTMAKSIGVGILEFSSELQRIEPDLIMVIGDRYEALAAVIATAYQNITIAHVQGGEVSGSIDESARHAITKFAHYHFPSTQRSADFLVKMGENPETVFCFGCPCGDYIMNLDETLPDDVFSQGIGAEISKDDPYLLVIYHPVTTEYGNEQERVGNILSALNQLNHKTVWLWPNIDAGADQVSKVLRRFREQNGSDWLRVVKNFEPNIFQKILKQASCAIGNSSSFVRDTTFSGPPVVLVGNRQKGREYGDNLFCVKPETKNILSGIQAQLSNGTYPASELYGDGTASPKIADALSSITLYSQKTLNYISE